MATFLLVHGSWHGAWCWHKILPRLKREGHTAIAIDLPGHGTDRTRLKEVTLDRDVDVLSKVIDAQRDPVILVGHSRGGISISQTAEHQAARIRKLVYLCAFLIPNGQAMLATALSDRESVLVSNLELNEEEGWHMVRREAFREAFYHDCSDEDVELATALLTPEPNAPPATPLRLTDGGYGRVPRVYIQTLQDKGITPAVQRRMYQNLPCEQVISMNTSHSPFLSAPDELTRHLIDIAEE